MRDGRRVLGALMLLIAGAGIAVLYFFPPRFGSMYPPCMFYTLTGYYCPGCGITRLLHALVHGRFIEAIGYNPLLALLLPLLGIWMAYSFLCWQGLVSDGAVPLPRWLGRNLPLFLLVMILVYWVARNIPFYPFTLLAP
jgi:hypothetical protein